MNHFALTIIGRDRPGIVSQTAEILFRQGCNIADSSSTILGGQFAMILIISHPAISDQSVLGEAFAPLQELGLSVFLRTLKPGGEKRTELKGEICMISVYGSDKPGIVYRVTRELSELKVNITDLNTKLVGSEARPVYVMMLEAVLPEEVSVERLAEVLKSLKQELQVDITVRSITPVEL